MFACPGNDIIGHLEEHVYCEILDLNTQILDTLPEEEMFTCLKYDIIESLNLKGLKCTNL